MRNNLKIIFICAAALLVVLILWLGLKEKESRPPLEAEISKTNTVPRQDVAKPTTDRQDVNISTNVRPVPVTPLFYRTNSLAPEEKLREAVESKNVQINFWGLVEDQDGHPLEGVKISGNTRTWYVTGTLGADCRFPGFSTASDPNGRFEIRNVSGDVLTIKSLEKEGYEPEQHAMRGFGFHTSEHFSSDPNSPTAFIMWKTNIHEHLITGDKRFHIMPDGGAYVIDLSNGTIAESGEGDLRVWIKYQPVASGGKLYDWSSEIDVINGGLLEETDNYSSMYSAPAEGYSPMFQYPQTPRQLKSGQRGRSGQHRFYVMLKNGQEYGRMTVDLVAPYNDKIPGLVEIQYAINPSGSRILKP